MRRPVRMIPAGHVLYELDRQFKAGKLAGYNGAIEDLYADGIHLNKTGQYMLGMTYYATLYKSDPRGLGGWDDYGITDAAVAAQIQDAAWQVVSTNPLTGVPEPSAVALLALAGLVAPAMRRRRA
jgi:hypothetical protein